MISFYSLVNVQPDKANVDVDWDRESVMMFKRSYISSISNVGSRSTSHCCGQLDALDLHHLETPLTHTEVNKN